jgi:futalosine hydrolase
VILVVCALRSELSAWVQRPGVDVVASGVGSVEAAAATAHALGTTRYDAVINAGIAGGFRGRARIGDAVIVAEERLADFGLEDGGPLVLPEGARLADRAFSNDDLLARVGRLPYRIATGVTVSRVTTTNATAARLEHAYDADVESMEGFAVLRACERASVPGLEVRGISNLVGNRTESGWDFGAGARACTAALDAALDALGVAPRQGASRR